MDHIILEQLVENKLFCKKVLPHLNPDFFDEFEDKTIFKCIKAFMNKFYKLPTYNVIRVAVSKSDKYSEDQFETIFERLQEIETQTKEDYDENWLLEETESWAKQKACENAVIKSADIIDDPKQSNFLVEDLFKQALAVNFDTDIGIDFFSEKSIKERWLKYHEAVTKFKSNLTEFNVVTGGGVEPKTFSCVMADTGEGKTNAMCSLSADFVKNGFNSLYVTLEMSEEKISMKHEANYMGVEINDIPDMDEAKYFSRLYALKTKSYGKLWVKEYPTASIATSRLRSLLEELRIKKDFMPDVIFVDYINLMLSDRYSNDNTYVIVKAIAEELRGLAVEYKVALMTGTQVNRTGAGNSAPSMTDVAESYGLPATCDFLWAIYSNEDLREDDIQIWSPLKNRFTGIIDYRFGVKTEFGYGRVVDLDSKKLKDQKELKLIQPSEKSLALVKKIKNKEKLKALKVNINDAIKSDAEEIFD